MFNEFLKRFLTNLLIYSFAFLLLGGFLIFELHKLSWVLVVILLILLASYYSIKDIYDEVNKNLKKESDEFRKKYYDELRQKEGAQKESNMYKQSLIEKNAGFPTLLEAIKKYEALRDEKTEQFLFYKKHRAVKASEIVKEETKRRREAEYEHRKTKAIIEYYESVAPFLADLKNDIVDIYNEELYRDYNSEELLDPTIHYLTKEEFRKLPSLEKNQMALDRFWQRPKSKWLLGRIYERYIGYLYEKQGYDVEYIGIFKGYEDLGRDLICRKGNQLIVIQCKNWSKFKTIYEKHIFQFFGTVFQYKDINPGINIQAIFYTTTKLSDLARRFEQELNINLQENFKFDKSYPSIRCNISRIDGTKIYHLPFDQQYDKVKIEKDKGEFYCATVKEAEDKGFRRAFRYKGLSKT